MNNYVRDIVRYKWIIVGLTLVFMIWSVGIALNLPNEYKATVMLLPANNEEKGGMGLLSGQLGGIASLAGLGGNTGDERVSLALELVNDWYFVDSFIKHYGIKAELLAVAGWDHRNKELVYDENLYNSSTKEWQGKGSLEPSDWQAFNEFKKRVSLVKKKDSPVIEASFTYFSPGLASEWLNALVDSINKKIQSMDVGETKKSIEYLNQQIENTSVAEMRAGFYQLLQEQLKTLMLSEVRDEYVLRKVGPIKVPESKSSPNRPVIVILGTLLGMLLALVGITTRSYLLELKKIFVEESQ